METPADPRSTTQKVAAWSGIVLMLPLAFLYLMSGLVAPPYGVGILVAIWVTLFILAIRLRRRSPWWTLLVPFAGLAVWMAVITLGDLLLGWTA